MPHCCVVPLCKGNYFSSGPKVSTFSFPSDPDLRKKWINYIHRKDFNPTKQSRVCELHFNPDDIKRETYYFDASSNKIVVPLKYPRLRKGAFPIKLPGGPSYLNHNITSRLSAEKKIEEREHRHLRSAISASIASSEDYRKKFCFSSFDEFLSLINKEYFEWTIVKTEKCVAFTHTVFKPSPVIDYSVIVNEELQLSAYYFNAPMNNLSSYIFPMKVENINTVKDVIDAFKDLEQKRETSANDIIDLIGILLSQLKELYLEDEHKISVIKFLSEQVKLLNVKKQRFRYSPSQLVFYSLLYSVSPHAYKFIRYTGHIIMPHPLTIKSVCSKYDVNPVHEQLDENFLRYIKNKFVHLDSQNLIVSLLIDEIHLKPCFDFKGGNIVGHAFDSEMGATSAYVFMINSLFSSYKDVAHILPVRSVTASNLHEMINKLIIELEKIGFKVVCVVSDNNAINRKAMKLFSTDQKLNIVYCHPSDPKRPLFFLIDTVHILKCIRNNWINQKNNRQGLYFPDFEKCNDFVKSNAFSTSSTHDLPDLDENYSNNYIGTEDEEMHMEYSEINKMTNKSIKMYTASFGALKDIHNLEFNNLLKFGYGLSLKALFPSNIERQNVPLVLQVFNNFTVEAMLEYGEKYNIPNWEGTAQFLKIICDWWSIVNVKTPYIGKRLNDKRKEVLTLSSDDGNAIFMDKVINWLDVWNDVKSQSGHLSAETHWAFRHTTYALLEIARYCIEELKKNYFLPGSLQTDPLEAHFGKYRRLSGSQYCISIRQLFESENKLRMQSIVELNLNSDAYGKIKISEFDVDTSESGETYSLQNMLDNCLPQLFVTDSDIENCESVLPVITYLAGYCIYSAIKTIPCDDCKNCFVLDKQLDLDICYKFIRNIDRGGLLCPHVDVINAVTYNYIVIQKLVSKPLESEFLKCLHQRELAYHATLITLSDSDCDIEIEFCNSGHITKPLIEKVLWKSTNTLLKNYCKKKNDNFEHSAKKQKIKKFQN